MNKRIAAATGLMLAISLCSLSARAHDRVHWSVTVGGGGYASPGYPPPGVVMWPPSQYSYGAPPSVYVPPPQILPPPPPPVIYVQPAPAYVLPPPAVYVGPRARLNDDHWGHERRWEHRHGGWGDGHDRDRDDRRDWHGGRWERR